MLPAEGLESPENLMTATTAEAIANLAADMSRQGKPYRHAASGRQFGENMVWLYLQHYTGGNVVSLDQDSYFVSSTQVDTPKGTRIAGINVESYGSKGSKSLVLPANEEFDGVLPDESWSETDAATLLSILQNATLIDDMDNIHRQWLDSKRQGLPAPQNLAQIFNFPGT